MLERDAIERIRTIFLHQRPHISIAEATVLLGWTDREMSIAIESGEVELEHAPAAGRLCREELRALTGGVFKTDTRGREERPRREPTETAPPPTDTQQTDTSQTSTTSTQPPPR